MKKVKLIRLVETKINIIVNFNFPLQIKLINKKLIRFLFGYTFDFDQG